MEPAPEKPTTTIRNSKRRNQIGIRIAMVILPLLVIGTGVYYFFAMRPFEDTDDAFIDGHVTAIAPQVPGRVVSLLVKDNQWVTKDDVLVEIDPRDYEVQLAQAQARLAAANTHLQQAKAQVVVDEARAEQEHANVLVAQAQAERAQADWKRYQGAENRSVSRSQLDSVATQARSTAAEVEVARDRGKAAVAQVALSKTSVETAAADVQQADAMARQAELELSYTKVHAPEDGFVTHRTVEVGAYVQTGQALLALVTKKVWVVANFKETQLTHMKPGQPVRIEVDAYPGKKFSGHVDSLQHGTGARFSLLPPENAAGNYVKVVQRVPVKIVFDSAPDPGHLLAPGMSVVPVVRVR